MRERLAQLSETVDLPKDFECPLCLEPMDEPVMTQSGHNYHRECIEQALSIEPRDPITRETASLEHLSVNLYLKNCIRKWVEENSVIEQAIAKINELETLNETQTVRIETLEETNKHYEMTLSDITNFISQMQERVEDYKKAVAERDKEISVLTSKNTSYIRKLQRQTQQLEKARVRQEESKLEIEELKAQLIQQQESIERLEEENREQRTAIKVLSNMSPSTNEKSSPSFFASKAPSLNKASTKNIRLQKKPEPQIRKVNSSKVFSLKSRMPSGTDYRSKVSFALSKNPTLKGKSNRAYFEGFRAVLDAIEGMSIHNINHSAYEADIDWDGDTCQYGFSYNADHEGYTILSLAVAYGLDQLVLHLLKAGVNANIPSKRTFIEYCDGGGSIESEYPRTYPLHLAVEQGAMKLIEHLLHYGAEVFLKDEKGNTPLHIACKNNHSRALQLLLDKGDETSIRKAMNTENKENQNLLMIIQENNSEDCLRLFSKMGVVETDSPYFHF